MENSKKAVICDWNRGLPNGFKLRISETQPEDWTSLFMILGSTCFTTVIHMINRGDINSLGCSLLKSVNFPKQHLLDENLINITDRVKGIKA